MTLRNVSLLSCLWETLSFARRDEHKAYWAIKAFNFDLQGAKNLRKFQLNELEELRNEACVSTRNYKEMMKLFHDKSIVRKNFEKNQQVLLYDSRLHKFPGKLKTRWDGPFIVRKVFNHGVVEVEDSRDGRILKVNGQRLKSYVVGVIPEEETMSMEIPAYWDAKRTLKEPYEIVPYLF